MAGKKRKWYSLYDKVYALENLQDAWERVRRNRGAGGIDGETLKQFEVNLEQNLQELHRLLREKRYIPPPVRRVYIPKADGRQRPLGIPTVRDRVVQQAVLNVIGPIYEAMFRNVSYGFRPGRSAHDAVAKIKEHYEAGYQWVVDADIQTFFDTLDHDLLMTYLREEIVDGSVLNLIRAWLTAGVMDEMELRTVVAGTPQGGVISPLLANIYLHQFDQVMTERGYRLVRYADDFVILCKLERKAQRALEVTRQVIEGQLRLKIHPEKTRVVHFDEGFEFLGFRFYWKYQRPRPKSLEAFKDKVRQATRRQQGNNLQAVLVRLNPVIRGWGNYQRHGNVRGLFRDLDQWIRMRLRAFIEKKKAVRHQNRRIPNRYFEEQGLVSLTSLLPMPLHPL